MNVLVHQIASIGPQVVTSAHFEHCYIYEGHHCSCGGNYQGDRPGPRLFTNQELPAMTRSVREWAGTTEDMYDLHRFSEDRKARCNPTIRTHSRITDHDEIREPYMTLRTRTEIESTGFANGPYHLYRFCSDCTMIAS
ncbi:hypothetical protein [Streptomyces sp. NPDC002746]